MDKINRKKSIVERNLKLSSLKSKGEEFLFGSGNDSELKFDLINNRLIYNLFSEKYYFLIFDFNQIKRFNYNSSEQILNIEYYSFGQLYYSENKGIKFNTFKGQTNSITRLEHNQLKFISLNVQLENIYYRKFDSLSHSFQFKRLEESKIFFLDQKIRESNLSLIIQSNKNVLKRSIESSDDDIESIDSDLVIEPIKKVKKDNITLCFEFNREKFNFLEESNVFNLPCNHKNNLVISKAELLLFKINCPNENCSIKYHFSFCKNTIVESSLFVHCLHTNNCQLVSNCKHCRN